MSRLSVPNLETPDAGQSQPVKVSPALATRVLAHLSNRINDTEIGFPAVT